MEIEVYNGRSEGGRAGRNNADVMERRATEPAAYGALGRARGLVAPPADGGPLAVPAFPGVKHREDREAEIVGPQSALQEPLVLFGAVQAIGFLWRARGERARLACGIGAMCVRWSRIFWDPERARRQRSHTVWGPSFFLDGVIPRRKKERTRLF